MKVAIDTTTAMIQGLRPPAAERLSLPVAAPATVSAP
jgi:hypothetical protein